jgi:integrase
VLDDEDKRAGSLRWNAGAIRLLISTGARLSEIRWDQVYFERSMLLLADSKTGKKAIYLNPPSLEVLRNLPRLAGNPYVICDGRAGRHLVNLEKPRRSIRTKAKLDHVRLNDRRHSYASIAASSGLSLPMIGRLLGHTQPQTTARYAHLSADPLQQANRRIGQEIERAIKARLETRQKS